MDEEEYNVTDLLPKSNSSKEKIKFTKPAKGPRGAKTVPFESVTMPMPDFTIFDKLLTYRITQTGDIEILVKFKATLCIYY